MKIEKPPQCQKLLEENRKYRLISEPQGDITPEVSLNARSTGALRSMISLHTLYTLVFG